MYLKPILALIAGLVNVIFGFLILRKNSKNSNNIAYFFLCFSGGMWGVVKFFQLTVLNAEIQNQLIMKLVFIFGVIAPLSFLLLAYNFPYKIRKYSKIKLFLINLIPSVLVFLIIIGVFRKHETFIINGAIYREIVFYDFAIFAVYFFTYVLWGFFILLEKYLKAEGIFRSQVSFLMIATIATFLTTGVVSIILLLFNNFTYDWLGAVFLLIHFSIAGYHIFIKSR